MEERRLTPGEAEVAKILIESGGRKVDEDMPSKEDKKPLKKARSEAELTRVRQGWTLIVLSSFNVAIALLLLAYQLGIL